MVIITLNEAFIPTLAPICAALIAGVMAFAGLIVSKESKISEFRHTWINNLRNELAGLFANCRVVARATEERRSDQEIDDLKFDHDNFIRARESVALSYYAIKLQVTLEDPEM